MSDTPKTDAPAQTTTPQRPGQPGEQMQRRPGPSPLSDHPAGPHAPYEVDDPEGLAAEKHVPGDATRPVDRKAGALIDDSSLGVLGKQD